MKYTIESLITRQENGEILDFLHFWGHTNKNDFATAACLSQWWVQPFVVAGVTYPTAEHWMMAKKALLFGDDDALAQILNCQLPSDAKAIGRNVKNFDQEVWEKHRFEFVRDGNIHKFGQNEAIKALLLDTHTRVLVEASPFDTVWGIGLGANHKNAHNPAAWNGLNLLGFALMEARDFLSI